MECIGHNATLWNVQNFYWQQFEKCGGTPPKRAGCAALSNCPDNYTPQKLKRKASATCPKTENRDKPVRYRDVYGEAGKTGVICVCCLMLC